MKYLCNPLNINYRYQFNKAMNAGDLQVARESADPSMVYFKGRYYIFASMTLGVWVSDDLVNWENHRLPDTLPLYDYAPDVCVRGEWLYWSASSREYNCSHFRTKDVLNGPWEEIPGAFEFWDPHMFLDDDGRVYFFWGCTNSQPIWGVEKDPETMENIGEPVGLVYGDAWHNGYERIGEDHDTPPASEEEVEMKFQGYLAMQKQKMGDNPNPAMLEQMKKFEPMIKGMFSNKPYIEGAWMNKYNGKYYLQYANPGTQYNGYNDGVYVSDKPLGPYTLAENNPFSYKPGGFLPGAGHGSTAKDKFGNYWHTATGRISINHNFERRVGLWPVGFDADGEMFCNQRYGDWPLAVDEAVQDPWRGPAWYLLSYNKKMAASSAEEGKGPEKACDENVQTWWRAASAEPGQWLCMDLGRVYDVRMVQVNFADDKIDIPVPGEIRGSQTQARYIDGAEMFTRWILEGSVDGENFFLVEDKSKAVTDLPHDLVLREDGIRVRYLRLTICEVPYAQQPCISGLRVFGNGEGAAPAAPAFTAKRTTDLDMEVAVEPVADAVGYNILWGSAPDKLYHSWMIFGTEQRVGALVAGREYYVRVDAFNESGITEGETVKLG